MSDGKKNPIPQGNYVPATRSGNFIFTAGMTPRKNGVLILSGKVQKDAVLENYREAVEQAACNALTAAQNQLESEEHILQILSLSVFVNAEEGFTAHSKLADIASEYLCRELGKSGIAARAAVGVATLPGNAPVEIQMVCAADKR